MNVGTDLRVLLRKVAPPAALRHSRPREVVLSAGGYALTVFSALFVAGAIVVAVFLTRELRREEITQRALIDHGEMTTADVVRVWRGDDSQRPHVAYRFQIQDRVYRGEARTSPAEWRTLHVGSPLAVRYMPEDPSTNDLGRTMVPRAALLWLPWVLSALLVGLAALCWIAVERQRQLLAEGRVAPAIVRAHKKHHTSHGGTHRSMTYDFALLNGALASGRSQTSNKPPAIGSVVWVVYDPDRPRRNMAYPFQLVRPRI